MECQFCNNEAQLVTGAKIYPHRSDLNHLRFWYCDNDHDAAYVGCHRGTSRPLGTLADAPTRAARSKAHAVFDPLWKFGSISRQGAYEKLRNYMGLTKSETHIGKFTVEQCKQVEEFCNDLSKLQ